MSIAAALDYIQENLAGDLSLEALAGRSGLSAYHFHRTFRAHVGEAPRQYVRRLRLEHAAVRLKQSTSPVTEVAFAAGYEAHEAFTRAFKSRFGVAPLQFRHALGAPPAISDISARIVRVPTQRVATLRNVGPYDGVGTPFEQLSAWGASRGLERAPMFAMYWDDQSITRPERTRCDVALVLAEPVDGDGAIRMQELRGSDYAVFRQVGSPAERRRLYDFAYRRWIPAQGRTASRRPPLETYEPPEAGAVWGATHVYIPLRAR